MAGARDGDRTDAEATRRPALAELAVVFLRLGCTAFGGPAALVALMEDEVVERRGWLSRVQFLDLLAATNLIPGPNSTELAIHIGLLAGWRGLIVAGMCFILPAALLVTACAWAYVEFGTLPEVSGVLAGVKPVLIAGVGQALWKLGRDSLKSVLLVAVAFAAIPLILLNVHELAILLGAGLVVMTAQTMRRGTPASPALPWVGLFAVAGCEMGALPFSLG